MAFTDEITFNGFAIVEDVLDRATLQKLEQVLESETRSEERRGGVRNLLDVNEIRLLATSDAVMNLVRPIL